MRRLVWFFAGQVCLMVEAFRSSHAFPLAALICTLVLLAIAGIVGDLFGFILRRLFRWWAAGGAPKGLPPTTPV